MNFISNNIDTLNIIQILIDKGCVLYGSSLRNFLITHNIEKLNIYIPSDEVYNQVEIFKAYFEYSIELKKEQFKFEISKINKNRTMWKINDVCLCFTILKPKPKKEINNLYLNKYGLSTFYDCKFKSIKVLQLLRKIKEKPDFNFKSINTMTEWIKYFLTQDNFIYGGWPSRYITSDKPSEMKRDIDIISNDMVSMENLMRVLNKTGLCSLNNNNKYKVSSLNVDINCDIPLKFDIHKNSKDITCDAFYNNLRMTNEHVTVNYQPENINYICIMLLIFNDLFNDKYTLICSFPKTYETKSEFRLITRPIILANERTVDYSYLEFSNQNFIPISDILSTDECCRSYHKINKELDFPPTVVQLGKRNICLHCMHKHVFKI